MFIYLSTHFSTSGRNFHIDSNRYNTPIWVEKSRRVRRFSNFALQNYNFALKNLQNMTLLQKLQKYKFAKTASKNILYNITVERCKTRLKHVILLYLYYVIVLYYYTVIIDFKYVYECSKTTPFFSLFPPPLACLFICLYIASIGSPLYSFMITYSSK